MDENYDMADGGDEESFSFETQDDGSENTRRTAGTGFTKLFFPSRPTRSFTWDMNYKMKGNYPHIYIGKHNKKIPNDKQFYSVADHFMPKSLEFKQRF
jgi:hypothetical protein